MLKRTSVCYLEAQWRLTECERYLRLKYEAITGQRLTGKRLVNLRRHRLLQSLKRCLKQDRAGLNVCVVVRPVKTGCSSSAPAGPKFAFGVGAHAMDAVDLPKAFAQ